MGVCLPLLKTLLCLCSEAWVRSPLAANPELALVHGWSACCASLERLAFGSGPLPRVAKKRPLLQLPTQLVDLVACLPRLG